MRRIKLKTEWVEWREVAAGVHRLYGQTDFVAEIRSYGMVFLVSVFCGEYSPDVFRGIGWRYIANNEIRTTCSGPEEAKEKCLHILIEHGLLDPLDLLLESVCAESS